MTTHKQTFDWNGQTLEIHTEANTVLTRMEGEEYTSLKVTSPEDKQPLIHDAFATSLIRQAGGAVAFVDVILTAQQVA